MTGRRIAHRAIAAALVLQATLLLACAQQVPLTILHYNDFHAQNTPQRVSKKSADGSASFIEVGGLAHLKSYIDRQRQEQPNAVLLHAGDDFQGTPISGITRGRSQIELLNLVRPDAMTLGNHEFDYGADNVRSLLPLATFPIVSANLFDKSAGRMFVPPATVLRAGAVTLGVIGLAPPDLASLSLRENVRDLDVLDAAKAVRQAMHDLRRAQDIDAIVVLSHMGVENDTAFARAVPGVDVIVGGHSHTPLFRPIRINDTWIVQAGSKGRWLGVFGCAVDTAANRVVSGDGRLIETLSSAVAPDPVLAAKIAELEAKVDEQFKEVLGTLETDWIRAQGPEESTIGNWQADVIREAGKADIGFMNNGGIRKDLAAGPISVRDIWEISPFDNEIVAFTVTGTQLLLMLRTQAQRERQFCQVSGLAYSFDPARPPDQALKVFINGLPVDPSKTYRVATNSYVGGQLWDHFNLPEAEVDVQTVLPGVPLRDIFIDAVRKQKTVRSALEGRIVIVKGDAK